MTSSYRQWRLGIVFALFLTSLLRVSPVSSSQHCLSPTLTRASHASSEASAARETVFIVSFDLTCKNELAAKPNLYAVLASGRGKALSDVATAAKTGAGYQVSFAGEHDHLPKGAYSLGFAALKKARRRGSADASEAAPEEAAPEEVAPEEAAVEPLARVTFDHGGAWKGEFLRGETVALALGLLAFYLAQKAKTGIRES